MMKKTYVLALVLGVLPVAAWGGDAPAAEEGGVPMMEEVVVTATKSEEMRKDVVDSVVLLDAVDIEESPAESVGQLLANQPGIDWRTRGNYGGASDEIHIRGMGADGTQVMLNGVVINSPSLGSADVSQVPLNSIDRIEVVKGPGSVLYGSGAMGGTVQFITKRPDPEVVTAIVEAGVGTESTYRLSAEQGMFVTGGLGYYLTANRKETDGFRDNSDLEHTDVSLNLVLESGEDFDVSLYNDYVKREFGLPGPQPPEGTADYFINGVKFYNSDSASLVNHGSDENHRSVLDVRGRMMDWLEGRVKADYSVQEGYTYSRYPWGGYGDETGVTNTIAGIEANLSATPVPMAKLIVGTEYRDFDYENEQQSLDSTGAAIPGMVSLADHGVYTQGTFGEVEVTPVDMVKLVAGFRYEEHSRFGSENVARFGAVIHPLADTVVKLHHGKHFKAPTMNDLFWPDDGFAKGNTDLKPETGRHTDVTLEQSLLENRLFATLSWFRWDITDKIDWAENPDEPTMIPGWNYWTPSNISSYEADGIEVGLSAGPFAGLTADLSYTYQDVEEELSPGAVRQARYKPEHLFRIGLTHAADFGLTTSVTARYVGDRPGAYTLKTDTTPSRELDGYWTVDVKLVQEIGDNWRVSLVATNLFDEEYATYLASFTDQTSYATTLQPYPGAGQSLFASVTYEF
ncbi:MAG: siderophore amonabactin TonB-dependent receptor [Desulfobulbaceae bacterium]